MACQAACRMLIRSIVSRPLSRSQIAPPPAPEAGQKTSRVPLRLIVWNRLIREICRETPSPASVWGKPRPRPPPARPADRSRLHPRQPRAKIPVARDRIHARADARILLPRDKEKIFTAGCQNKLVSVAPAGRLPPFVIHQDQQPLGLVSWVQIGVRLRQKNNWRELARIGELFFKITGRLWLRTFLLVFAVFGGNGSGWAGGGPSRGTSWSGFKQTPWGRRLYGI